MGGGEMDGFQALASGVLEDDLTQKQSDQVLEYLQDFLRGAQKLKGNQEVSADKYNGYTIGESMENMKSFLDGLLDRDYDTGEVDADRTSEFWDYDRRVSVSYDTSGKKFRNYDFEDDRDFKRLDKDLKSGRVKGIIYEDGYETRVAGKGITVLSPGEGGSAYFRFEQGKLPKK